MADFPFPTFATLEKLYGWATEQATVFGLVLPNPAKYYTTEIAPLPHPLPSAIKFLAFVVLVASVFTMPIDAILWKINVFDLRLVISGTVLFLISVALFSFTVYWVGRLIGGRGDLPHSLAAMFHSAAFIPILMAPNYLTRLDPDFRTAMLTEDVASARLDSPLLVLGALLEAAITIWIVVKVVPVIRVVHGVGGLRALAIMATAGALYMLYEWVVWLPFFAELLKTATKA
jgi:hypothetical protein